MKIWIKSNMHLQCGISQYGWDLAGALRQIEDAVYLGTDDPNLPVDAIIVNWHSARLHVDPQWIVDEQKKGRKVVVILHNSWEGIKTGPPETDILAVADCVVTHERMAIDGQHKKVVYIKHGLTPATETMELQKRIGTAGFPFFWKRFDVVAAAAVVTGCQFLMFAPSHDGEDVSKRMNGLAQQYGTFGIIDRNWHEMLYIVNHLTSCMVNIFWHQPPDVKFELGQSGSVLMGVAARRPIIISRNHKMRVLLEEYPEEVYVADTEAEVYDMAKEIVRNTLTGEGHHNRRPRRACEEMAWSVIGPQFYQLLEQL